MFSVSKLKSAAGASTYFRDRDDYYLSDTSSAEWWGHGAAEMGLAGEVDARDFRDLLNGKIGGRQAFPAGTRTVKTKGGKSRKVPAHMPGWDATFSAPKSVSVAGLVHGDDRLVAAHDAAVRTAMQALEGEIAVTRQRGADGGYEYRHGAGIAAAMFRHASSRNLDPDLHTHVVIPNAMRDPVTGKWSSIDSREGLYKAFHEAESLYKNELASRARELGYGVEWSVGRDGFPDFELTEIPQSERDVFSTRKQQIDAKLAAGGLTRDQATRAERQQAALETRSPKHPVPGDELRRDWRGRLPESARNMQRPEATQRPDPTAAADAAVASAAASISERAARFTPRDLLTEARLFSQGHASEMELQDAMRRAARRGELIDTDTLARVPGGALAQVPGFTTKAGRQTERDMLATVERMHQGGRQIMPAPEANAAVEAADAASGNRLTDEHKVAIRGILSDDSRIQSIQGVAGSAKTSAVLANLAAEARKRGWNVQALAPTASAADTLGQAIGAKGGTVAAFNLGAGKADGNTLIVADEAGLIGASDMQKLLRRADESGAKLVLVGDVKQIGSVQAGSAFGQIQAADPAHTYELTKTLRQRNEALRTAVEAAARGDVRSAFAGIEIAEHKPAGTTERDRAKARADAVADVAARYMDSVSRGKDTLVVALSKADRDAINAAIQNARAKAGQVRDVADVVVLRPKDWTRTQRSDAARYAPGDVIQARKDVAHLAKGRTTAVVGVADGKVTVRNRADGQEWSFDPAHYKSFTAHDAETVAVGTGDKLTIRGKTPAQDAAGNWRNFQNGDSVTVTGRGADGGLKIADAKDREYTIAPDTALQADLGYASTADSAQGRTVDDVIGYARAGQTNLATQQRMYVAASRARDHATLVTDDARRLADQMQKHSGQKETALDGREPPTHGPEPNHGLEPGTPARQRPRSFLGDVARASRDLMREVAAGRAQAVRDRAARSLREGQPQHLTAEQAAVAAKLALQQREDNRAHLLPRDPPGRDQWRKMVKRHGEAIAPDGTRYTQDDRGGVYSDRMTRADRREIVRGEWVDPKQRNHVKIVGERGDTHAIVSHDHGKTWHKAGFVEGLAARYRQHQRDKLQSKLELDRARWQAGGGKETHDSEWLAREAVKSFRQREAKLFKGKLDWDSLAARNGVAYDKQGHRYTLDNRGHVWSEALAKRGMAAQRSRAGRDAMQDMQRHAQRGGELARDARRGGGHHLLGRAAHAAGYRNARRRLEQAIGDGQQRELDRLAGLVLAGEDRRHKAAGGHETRDSRQMAREALARQGKGDFDWDKAAMARGVHFDRDGRRYTTDEKGYARSEALEKTAYHYRFNSEARAAKDAQDRGGGRGLSGWRDEQRTRAAVWGGVEKERARLGELAGVEGRHVQRDAAKLAAQGRAAERQAPTRGAEAVPGDGWAGGRDVAGVPNVGRGRTLAPAQAMDHSRAR